MLFRTIKPLIGLIIPIQRYPMIYKVQFGFYFQNNQEQEIKAQIQQIKKQISVVKDPDEIIDGYQKIIKLRQRMESKEDEICIEMLLDKAKLAKLLFHNKMNKEFIEKLIKEDLTPNIRFHNIPLNKYPQQYEDYLINQYQNIILQNKILLNYKESETKDLLEWAQQYLQSIIFLKEYQEKNYDFLKEEECFLDRKQIEVNYNYERSTHDQLVGDIYRYKSQYDKAIQSYERGLQAVDSAMIIVNQMLDQQWARDIRVYLNSSYGSIFEIMGQMSIRFSDKQLAKSYLGQACNALRRCDNMYANRFWSAYNTLEQVHKDIKITEQIFGDQYKQLQSNYKTPVGKVEEKLNQDTELYRQEYIQIDYFLHAASLFLKKKQIKKCYNQIDSVLNLIKDIQDESVLTRYLDLIDLVNKLPIFSIQRLNYLNSIYSQIKNISTKQKQIQFHVDYQVSILEFTLRHSLKLSDDEQVRFKEFIETYQDKIYQPTQIKKIYEMAQIVFDQRYDRLSREIFKKGLEIIKNQKIEGIYEKLYEEKIQEFLEN